MKKLGLGIQELSKFKINNYIYVDKTEIIYKLITTGEFYFLSRPRRFGKSLLVNTMDELFSGNKELFENTWIYDKWDFEDKYQVIKIGVASLDYFSLGLEHALDGFINDFASKSNIKLLKTGFAEKFKELIVALGKDKPVVILIDEYDKPIIDYIEDMGKAEKNRQILKNFYSVVKDCDKYIKLLFITGVSKFSKVSFFSELNNLTDITLSKNYSQIVGYTENEIISNYSEYIVKVEEEFKISREKALEFIKLWYNGYSWDGNNFMYNPYSVLSLLNSKSFSNYWFNTGTPTFLTKIIKNRSIDIDKFETSFEVRRGVFDSYDLESIDINILLFQAGYLTIKEKIINSEDLSESYKLAYPNKEVKDSFYDYLIGEFTGIDKTNFFEITKNLKEELEINNIEGFISRLKTIYSQIPSNIFLKENESYYHTVIYLILKLLKADIVEVEKQTNKGRIDAVILTKKYIFVMEFKMSNVNEALKQIKEKKYYEPYISDGREVFCVGVAFDKEERNIKEYKVLTVQEMENYL
ncbi:MAG: ATP-binding protein [Candidatus Delongbacteria bacterium]|nr:ATP-binding protein [Candidatus Delongbacteria bacterium]MBN2836988.1 ATP-binding protein [Candidatus Delongbacteria bacterium]